MSHNEHYLVELIALARSKVFWLSSITQVIQGQQMQPRTTDSRL